MDENKAMIAPLTGDGPRLKRVLGLLGFNYLWDDSGASGSTSSYLWPHTITFGWKCLTYDTLRACCNDVNGG